MLLALFARRKLSLTSNRYAWVARGADARTRWGGATRKTEAQQGTKFKKATSTSIHITIITYTFSNELCTQTQANTFILHDTYTNVCVCT